MRRREQIMKSYIGAYERTVDCMVTEGKQTIEINWINMSPKEAGSGGADRVTKKLINAGYRPKGMGCNQKFREAYENGRKVDGRYIRMPQEIWLKKAETPGAGAPRDSK